MLPYISIIVPCYNEEKTIRALLDSIRQQAYPLTQMELVISDGMSTDHTRDVITQFQNDYPDLLIHVVENPLRTIPSGLNQAIRNAKGEIIIRLDAHSIPIRQYIERCVAAHQAGKGDNIGGVWEICAGDTTWIAESISFAAAHPLGVGDAMYRLQAKEGPVDTVPFGSFRRTLLDKIGFFDESLLANEDYEFNTRVRESGGVVWLDPSIRSIYFARSTLGKLASQYWRYGYWKLQMLKRYPHTIRWRQALPPMFVLGLIGLIVLSFWIVSARYLLLAEIGVYLLTVGLAGLKLAIEKKKIYLAIGLPLAIGTMHLSWGAGFLWSLISNRSLNHG
jgi:glycosyltransferase involved in cell wall biosynthesis